MLTDFFKILKEHVSWQKIYLHYILLSCALFKLLYN